MPEAVPHLLHPGEMTVETFRQGLSYKVVLGLRCSEGPVRVLHLVGDVADVTRAEERHEDAPAGSLGWQLSSLSRSYIDLFKGYPEKCDQTQLDRSLESHAALANSYINRANCVAAEIVRDLPPTAARLMMPAITPAR